jgi:hypothetical protein
MKGKSMDQDRNGRIIHNGDMAKEAFIGRLDKLGQDLVNEIEGNADLFIRESELPLRPEDAMNFVMDQMVVLAKLDLEWLLGNQWLTAVQVILTGEITKRLNA